MTTLDIGGNRVTVDDSFLSMTPEQQNATVDEIAKSLQVSPASPEAASAGPMGPVPGADFAVPKRTGYQQFQAGLKDLPDRLGAGAAFATGALESVPVAGPWLRKGADSISAGIGSMLTGRPYEDVRREMGEMVQADQQQYPGVTTAGKIAGAVGPLVAAPQSLFASPGAAAGTGGLISGADSISRNISGGEYDPAKLAGDAAKDTAIGAAGGWLGWHAGRFLQNAFSRLTGKGIPAETATQLKDTGSQFYKAMDDAGVKIRPASYSQLVGDIDRTMRANFATPDTAPEVTRALKILDNAKGQDLSLRDLDKLRQTVRDILPSNASDADKRLIGKMVGFIDGYVDRLPDNLNAVTSGTTPEGVAALKQARDFWKAGSKTENIAQAFDNATLSAESGRKPLDRAVQDEFAKLYRSLREHPSGFTQDEIDTIRGIATGSNLTAWLNRLDRWGGPMLSPVVKSVTMSLRNVGSSGSAMRGVLDVTGGMSPSRRAVTPVLEQLGAAGGLTGTEAVIDALMRQQAR